MERGVVWELDDWKDVAEVVRNFAATVFMIVAAVPLLKWVAKNKH
jgi:hypothetical protein